MMTDSREQMLVSVWNAAAPMWHASYHLAPPDIRNALDELKRTSAIAEANESVKQSKLENPSWFDILGMAIIGANRVLAPRRALVDKAQALLLADLVAGRMIGLGYEPPRRLQSVPVYIPAKYWRHSIDWELNTVVSGGLTFIDVRVISPKSAQSVIDKIAEMTRKQVAALPPPPGRPSVKPHVEAAFAALLTNNQIDTTTSANSHFPIVKQWIKENTSYKTTDLSDEGIRAHFAPLFKELRKNRKQ